MPPTPDDDHDVLVRREHTGGPEYLIGYATEDAEGMYHCRNGKLVWQNSQDENLHVEIAVCDVPPTGVPFQACT